MKNHERESRSNAIANKDTKPTAAVRPRGKSVPRYNKPPATVPVTPNVLKSRRPPRLMAFQQPEPFKFKAKPAPFHKHKSCGNLLKITDKPKPTATQDINIRQLTHGISKLALPPKLPQTAPTVRRINNNKENDAKKEKSTVSNKTRPTATSIATTTTRKSRQEVRAPAETQQVAKPRSSSVPGKSTRTATIPVTPMVLKRTKTNRLTVNKPQQALDFHFKAKPAGVLSRKPFQPKLAANINLGGTAPGTTTAPSNPTKPFDLYLEDRVKDRKLFNHRSTNAMEKKQKQTEEDKKRAADEQYAAARLKTNFRATRNPFK